MLKEQGVGEESQPPIERRWGEFILELQKYIAIFGVAGGECHR